MSGVGWGILGTGMIAHDFARALTRVEDACLAAVGSRTPSGAAAFAQVHAVGRAHGSVEELLADPQVDVVYVASPQSEHHRHALDAVAAGKHLLVEKPFALSACQSKEVFDAASEAGVFVMEALWSRFLPAHVRLRELVTSGAIGEVRSVDASFGFPLGGDPSHRLLDLARGGGALLDLGIYPINTAVQLLGAPEDVVATAHIGPSGVDLHTAVAMRFAGGAVATARCSLSAADPCTARIVGTEGVIELPPMHFAAEYLDVRPFFGETERILLPIGGDGLRYQVHEVHACLSRGDQQSRTMPWDDTLTLMRVLDRARAAIGLDYGLES